MFDYCNFLRTNWDNCISADNEIVTLLSRLELAPLKFDPKKVETQQCFAVINAKNTLAGYIKKGENSSIEAKLIHDSGISIKVSVFFSINTNILETFVSPDGKEMIEATIIKGVDTSGYTIVTRIYDSSNLKIIGTKSYRNLSILPEFISTDSYMKIDGLETVSAAQDAINKKVIGTFGFGKKLKRENPRAFQRKFKKELGKF